MNYKINVMNEEAEHINMIKKMCPENTTNQTSRSGPRDNNFAIVRLMGALLVFAGHQSAIMDTYAADLGGIPIQEMGVGILFLISGYLITKSWLSDPNPLRYAIRRFLRLWPPFAVMVLLLAYVAGPLLSELGINGYFAGGYYPFLKNLRFFIIYYLPGVFTDLPIPNCVNGSMWTMPVEAALYIITPLLLTVIRVKKNPRFARNATLLLVIAALIFDTCNRALFPNARKVIYATEFFSSWHIIVFYLIGILFTFDEFKKLLNLQIGCVAISLTLFMQLCSMPVQYLTMNLVLPYFILSLVFDTKPVFHSLGQKIDLSYGIYLYGFFFQQLTVYYLDLKNWSLPYIQVLLISAVPTVITAILSYYLVEKPTMKLSRYLVNKLKEIS